MRSTKNIILAVIAAATVGWGCGGAVPVASQGAAVRIELPACGQVHGLTVAPGALTVEDLDGGRLLVRSAGVAICVGSVADPFGEDPFGTDPFGEGYGGVPGPRVLTQLDSSPTASDPMPADDDHPDPARPEGASPGASDPMPAEGIRPVGATGIGHAPAASDPMPADDDHPAASDPMPARGGDVNHLQLRQR